MKVHWSRICKKEKVSYSGAGSRKKRHCRAKEVDSITQSEEVKHKNLMKIISYRTQVQWKWEASAWRSFQKLPRANLRAKPGDVPAPAMQRHYSDHLSPWISRSKLPVNDDNNKKLTSLPKCNTLFRDRFGPGVTKRLRDLATMKAPRQVFSVWADRTTNYFHSSLLDYRGGSDEAW